jgi:hypothetical protein
MRLYYMDTNIIQRSCLMLTMAMLVSQNAMALKVFQWTDEEGVVHYSDTPPQENNAVPDINEFEVVDYTGNNADSDKYSIINQLETMTEWRRQAEADQRAWKQLELEEERLAQEQEAAEAVAETSTDDTYYLPGYFPRAYYHPYPVNYPGNTKRRGHHLTDNQFTIGKNGRIGKFSPGFNQPGFGTKGSFGKYTTGFNQPGFSINGRFGNFTAGFKQH